MVEQRVSNHAGTPKIVEVIMLIGPVAMKSCRFQAGG